MSRGNMNNLDQAEKSIQDTAHTMSSDLSKAWGLRNPSILAVEDDDPDVLSIHDFEKVRLPKSAKRYRDGQDVYAHEIAHAINSENNKVIGKIEDQIKRIEKRIMYRLKKNEILTRDFVVMAKLQIIKNLYVEMVASFVGYQLYVVPDWSDTQDLKKEIPVRITQINETKSQFFSNIEFYESMSKEKIAFLRNNLFAKMIEFFSKIKSYSGDLGRMIGKIASTDQNLSANKLILSNPSRVQFILDHPNEIDQFLADL